MLDILKGIYVMMPNMTTRCTMFEVKLILTLSIIIMILFLLPLSLLMPAIVYAHGGSEQGAGNEMIMNEKLILSKYHDGNIDSANPQSEEWMMQPSYTETVQSLWDHDINVTSINNGTHLYFLLSWDDNSSSSANDGAAIIFEKGEPASATSSSSTSIAAAATNSNESMQETKAVWYWSNNNNNNESNGSQGLFTASKYDNGHWNVLMGKKITNSNNNNNINNTITFTPGEREEGFIKFVVWDGAKNQSFSQVNDENLTHLDFLLLPRIDTQPKDVYVWAGIIVVGAASFIALELRLYPSKRNEWRRDE